MRVTPYVVLPKEIRRSLPANKTAWKLQAANYTKRTALRALPKGHPPAVHPLSRASWKRGRNRGEMQIQGFPNWNGSISIYFITQPPGRANAATNEKNNNPKTKEGEG